MKKQRGPEIPDPVFLREDLIRPLMGMEVRCAWCRDKHEQCVSCWHEEWQLKPQTFTVEPNEKVPYGYLFAL